MKLISPQNQILVCFLKKKKKSIISMLNRFWNLVKITINNKQSLLFAGLGLAINGHDCALSVPS